MDGDSLLCKGETVPSQATSAAPMDLRLALLLLAGFLALSAASKACLQTPCSAQNLYADYVFLVDSSRSMGRENFEAVKRFLESFAASVRIGTDVDRVQMQIITYSLEAAAHGTLQQGSNAAFLNKTIQALVLDNYGDRDMSKALQLEEATVTGPNGLRPGAKHVLVAIGADSFSGTLPESDGLLSKVRAKYDALLALGVGPSAVKNAVLDLEQFAGNDRDTMFVSSVDQLDYAMLWIQKNGCPKSHVITTTPAPTPKPTQAPSVTCQLSSLAYDIYLLVDSSLTLGTAEFQKVKDELVEFVRLYSVTQAGAQFGLTTVSVDAELFYTGFHQDQTKANFINKLLLLTQDGSDGQALKLAFQSVEHVYLAKASSGRPQLAIYLSANTAFDTAPFAYIQSLKSKYGLKTLAVRVGPSADLSALQKVAGGASCVFDATSASTPSMSAWLQESTCKKAFC
uniref:VWFA domain-containing protein n=1 Tax=Steinernema glaseri TaxID=37863 RepID=A0A1I7XVY3_9BILA